MTFKEMVEEHKRLKKLHDDPVFAVDRLRLLQKMECLVTVIAKEGAKRVEGRAES